MTRTLLVLFCTAVLLMGVEDARAQWSDDPAVNLVIADLTGEQTQPRVSVTADDGAYVSWFSNSGAGYDVYLQKLDAGGNELWPHGGVLIADRSFTSTQDYDLDIDTSGNALLTFRDDRVAGTQVTATKVDTNGTQLWGPTGVQLTSGGDFVGSPKIAGTTDGNAIVAWTNNFDVRLQKLDGSGTPLWGAGVTILAIGGDGTSASDLDASDAGGAILSMVRGFLSPKHLHAQKFDTDGNALWGVVPLAVFDGGTLQTGNFPQFVPDGSGGGVFAWYSTNAGLQCHASWVQSDSTEAFGHNGVTVSTALRDRTQPTVLFNAGTSETFVFWREEGSGPDTYGVYGQKFDAGGVRQWGTEGVVVEPLSTTEVGLISPTRVGDAAVVLWAEAVVPFSDDRIHAARLEGDGTFAWAPSTVDVSTVASAVSRLTTASTSSDAVFAFWKDERDDNGDVYGQNINADGTLGGAGPVPTVSEWGAIAMASLMLGAGAFIVRRRRLQVMT